MKRISVLLALAAGLVLSFPALGSPPSGAFTQHDAPQYFTKGVTIDGTLTPAKLKPAAATKLTIASGVITVTQLVHTVETQSAASSDDLDTINGGSADQLLILRPFSGSHDVVLKHATGNIQCPGQSDITLAEADDYAILVYSGSNWAVVATKLKAASTGVADGSITTAKLASNAVTGAKINSASLFLQFQISGRNGAGAVTLTGAAVGDKVVAIWALDGMNPLASGASDMESTITVTNQIQQSSGSDKSSVQYFGLLLKKS